MDQGQDRTLLDESLGETVFFQYMGAKAPSDEHIADLLKNPDQVVYSQPQELTFSYFWKPTTSSALRFGPCPKTGYDPLYRGGPFYTCTG